MKMLILYGRLPKLVDSEDIEASSFRQSLLNRGDFLIGLCSFTKVSQDSKSFLCFKHFSWENFKCDKFSLVAASHVLFLVKGIAKFGILQEDSMCSARDWE